LNVSDEGYILGTYDNSEYSTQIIPEHFPFWQIGKVITRKSFGGPCSLNVKTPYVDLKKVGTS
jgi:hypothetical protein